ncbi:hypothetical protein F4810DRAFT_679234 [Camillea tinctor]|nr:hypothetical protein F4810DRAFT_679234 [Camillea tinctor]
MDAAESLFRVVVSALVLDTLAFGLRILVRTRLQGSLGYDDAVMAIGFVGYIILSAFTFLSLDWGFGSWPERTHDDPQIALKFWTISQLTYVLTAGIVKIGVALILFRINVDKVIRNVLLVSMVVVFAVTAMFFLVLTLQCRPLSLLWGVGQGSCINFEITVRTGIAFSAIDIVLNWLYSLIPIPMLWKVQIGPHLKIAVLGLFGIGVLSSIATVVRFKYIVDLAARNLNIADDRSNDLRVLLWSHVEVFLAILTSSLLNLRPLLRHITNYFRTLRSRRKGYSQGGSTELDRVIATERDASTSDSLRAMIRS